MNSPSHGLAPDTYTDECDGYDITYDYTSGRSYNVKFEPVGVSYRYLTGDEPDRWWGPFPYQAMTIAEQVFFVSWFEVEYMDHVVLLVNLPERKLHGSALLGGKTVHFHSARIIDVRPPSR